MNLKNLKKFSVFPFIIFILFINNNKLFSADKEFVSMINSYFDEKEGVVVINWDPIENPKAVYKIYRLNVPIKGSKYYPQENDLIKVLSGNISKAIDIPTVSGKYYYFITVFINQKENPAVLPDQNYTYQPVEYYKPAGIVRGIQAKYINQTSEVLLKWEHPAIEEKASVYHIYRSTTPIDRQNVEFARKIAEISSDKNIYFDKIENVGKYFYAVTSISEFKLENTQIIPEQNTLSKPVAVVSLDERKLPDFYIYFPVEMQFDYNPSIKWIDIPSSLPLFPVDINLLYENRENILETDQKTKEEEKKIKEDKKDVKKELEIIYDFLKKHLKDKSWADFIVESENVNKTLKSVYVQKKLLFFKAYAYFKLKNYSEALLIIASLKSDKKFVKYNEKKLLNLEEKIKEEQEDK